MAWKSQHNFARISQRKVQLLVNLIRGRSVNDALGLLKFTPNRAAIMVKKVLSSAVANADEAEADVDELIVSEAFVNGAPTMKRFQPKDRGRAHPILKRTSHITVVVDEARK